MPTFSLNTLFHFDLLAIVMIFLVGFIGTVVSVFASRYMQGDSQYNRFFWKLSFLITTVIIMVSSDNLFLMLAAWGVSNIFLIILMIHKPQWKAALNAGLLTSKTFAFGFVSLFLAFFILYYQTKETSIQAILDHFNPNYPLNIVAMILILIAAMTQSAIWPFHRWLLSSLNAPTPVSALMHAGLINGGGFLLVRFAPMYTSKPTILTLIFVLGITTAFLGTLWKLMQHDVKRMLACSTMGQMGFMLAQCGLGMFPAAVAHLCWHGMFKANLFLSSNGAAQENRFQVDKPLSLNKFILAMGCGLVGSYCFSLAIHSAWLAKDTTFILIGISFITASQFSLSLLINSSWQRIPIVITLTALMTYGYGWSVYFMESIFQSMNLFHPQPLNIIHLLSLILFVMFWVIMSLKDIFIINTRMSHFLQSLYIKSLNASQPHPSTITSHRNDYRYE